MKKILFVFIVAIALFFAGCAGESSMSNIKFKRIARSNNGNIAVLAGNYDSDFYFSEMYTGNNSTSLRLVYSLSSALEGFFPSIVYRDTTIITLFYHTGRIFVLVSNDNGSTFKSVEIPNEDSPHAIDYDGTIAVLACYSQSGNSNIFLSNDHGNTWVKKTSIPNLITKIKIANGKIVVCGVDTPSGFHHHGVLWMSSDNGTTWTQANIPSTMALIGVSHFNNNIIACEQSSIHDSKIIVSHDNGTTWTTKNVSMVDINQIVSYGSTSIIINKSNNYLLSNDNGDTWTFKSVDNKIRDITYNGTDALTVGNDTVISRLTGTDFIALSTEPSHLHGCEVAGEVITFAQFKPNTLESPLHYCDKNGEIKSIALVKPGTRAGSRFRIKVDPSSEYAKMLLGENNDGILAFQTYVQ